MLALEEVYDVTMVKDGQEAYDTVKSNMERGQVFDLIFMDIQVFMPCQSALGELLTRVDAKSRRHSKYTTYSRDGILCTDRRTQCFRRREQYQGLHGLRNGHVYQVGVQNSTQILFLILTILPSKPIRRPALKQVLNKFATIPEESETGLCE
jgi:osomolarity two-component system sensor histidine kinase SLN1